MIVHEDSVTFVHSHPDRDLEPQTANALPRAPAEARPLSRVAAVPSGGRVQTAEFQIRAEANP